jgi:hypothetical protein
VDVAVGVGVAVGVAVAVAVDVAVAVAVPQAAGAIAIISTHHVEGVPGLYDVAACVPVEVLLNTGVTVAFRVQVHAGRTESRGRRCRVVADIVIQP